MGETHMLAYIKIWKLAKKKWGMPAKVDRYKEKDIYILLALP
jgi:hypothetical protein